MDNMISFLKESKRILGLTEKICFVLGNESCDLDSAVSAIALAYFYSKCRPSARSDTNNFVPLLNIPRTSFPIKTEVVHYLHKYNISDEDLVFKDDTSDDFIKTNSVVLVDHHVSKYNEAVVEVFDHRPLDNSSNLPKSCNINMKQVGSCATLIGNLILNSVKNHNEFNVVFELLYGAIVLDTVNFSRQACRATELDFNVVEQIESVLGITDPIKYRENVFNELVKAREDISTLTAYQLLNKDMKIISNQNQSIIVGIPGYPTTVQEFLQKADAKEAVENFSKEFKCNVVLLIGMKITDGSDVKRDVGVINFSNESLFNKIIEELQNHNTPNLELKEHINCNFLGGRFFQQGNIRATRKHILPIVKNLIEN